ncbi:MAG: hypothetical protein K0B08_00930 [Bacteroidales bacterium]|nr:hypothetical protein [Bacteroidales bacterium]
MIPREKYIRTAGRLQQISPPCNAGWIYIAEDNVRNGFATLGAGPFPGHPQYCFPWRSVFLPWIFLPISDAVASPVTISSYPGSRFNWPIFSSRVKFTDNTRIWKGDR